MVALTDPLLAQLTERLASRDVSALASLSGGASSLTYVGRCADRLVVVKVAPPGVQLIAHRDVLRQARAIRALAMTPVPVPEVLFDDPGDPPDVPPLFVMSHVDGSTSEPLFDDADAGPKAVVAERFRNAAAIMAQLHGIEPGAVGLASEPVIGPSAEVERWCRTLETVDPALVPGWNEVAAALKSSTPPAVQPAIVHGDFRLGNLLAVDGRITAVIDWEIWSVGDPRVDAGWFLINCDPRTYRRSARAARYIRDPATVRAGGGLPRRAGTRSAGTGLVPGAGLLQVRGDMVTDHQAQSATRCAGPEPGGDGSCSPAVTFAGPRVARLVPRNAGELVGELGFGGLA